MIDAIVSQSTAGKHLDVITSYSYYNHKAFLST